MLRILFLFFFLLLPISALFSDKIFLKNGDVLYGKYQELNDNQSEIRVGDESVKFEKIDIKSIVIGSEYNEAVLKFKDDTIIENISFVSLVKKNNIVIYNIDKDIYEEYLVDNISFIKILPERKFYDNLSLSRNYFLKVKNNKGEDIVGKFESIVDDKLLINSNKSIKLTKIEDIAELTILFEYVEPAPRISTNFNILDFLVPGYFRYRKNDKIEGAILLSAAIATSVLIFDTKNKGDVLLSKQRSQNEFATLLNTPYLLNFDYNKYAEYRQQNRTYGALLAGIYLISISDVLLYRYRFNDKNDVSLNFLLKSDEFHFGTNFGVNLTLKF